MKYVLKIFFKNSHIQLGHNLPIQLSKKKIQINTRMRGECHQNTLVFHHKSIFFSTILPASFWWAKLSEQTKIYMHIVLQNRKWIKKHVPIFDIITNKMQKILYLAVFLLLLHLAPPNHFIICDSREWIYFMSHKIKKNQYRMYFSKSYSKRFDLLGGI